MVMTKTSGFGCMECGRKFKTVSAAEKASSAGCPKCGGVDIDLADDDPAPEPVHHMNDGICAIPGCKEHTFKEVIR